MFKKDIFIQCKCGCGTPIHKYRSNYDEVRYVKGHQKSRLGKHLTTEQKDRISLKRKGKMKGKLNHKWKGKQVGYYALHSWLGREKTKKGICEHCDNKRRTAWANKSHEYKRDLKDWLELCRPCHMKYDKKTWGEATRNYINGET